MDLRFSPPSGLPGDVALSRVQWVAVVGVVLLAALIRFSHVNSVVVDVPWRADAGKYVTLALNWVAHSAYSLAPSPPFTPTHYITPGYPAFLALFMGLAGSVSQFNAWVLNAQAALGTLSVLLTFLIGRASGAVAVGLGAALLLAISPHHVLSNGYLLTETLFTFLLLVASWLTVVNWQRQRLWVWLLIGAIAAGAALVRPVLLIFPLVIAVPLVLCRIPARKIGQIVLCVSARRIGISTI